MLKASSFVGIDVDLVLLLKSADRSHLGHAGHGLELVAKIPVLERSQLGQVVLAGLVHQGILIDPADARGVRAQFRADAFRQLRKDFREVFERAAPRPVEVGPVLENHVDVGEAEVGKTADGLDLRRSQHGRHDRISDLVLDDVGASVPAGIDDDLRIGEVGNRVQRHLTHPVDAPTMATRVKIITRYLLRALNSMMRSIMIVTPPWLPFPPCVSRRLNRMRLSESIRKLADVTICSPSLSPSKTWIAVAELDRADLHRHRHEMVARLDAIGNVPLARPQHGGSRHQQTFAHRMRDRNLREHPRLENAFLVGQLDPHLHRPRHLLHGRLDEHDFPDELPIRQRRDRHRGGPAEFDVRNFILVDLRLHPNGREIADDVQFLLRRNVLLLIDVSAPTPFPRSGFCSTKSF